MGAFSFGGSWLGIVFNPAGYLIGRKSPTDAAAEYISKNPTSITITDDDTDISFQEDRNNWINACAAKLKSDDVGKSKANCLAACQSVFDNDSNVVDVKNFMVDREQKEADAIKASLQESGKNILLVVGACLFIGLIIYLLSSKSK